MSPHRQASVLLVDDQPENLLALEAVLRPLGLRTVRATSGEEALRKLLHDDFAVILLDVQMPDMNGFETAQYIKQRERTQHIPIIFLTAIDKERQQVLRLVVDEQHARLTVRAQAATSSPSLGPICSSGSTWSTAPVAIAAAGM